ncbi:MAG: hypothetical protein KJ927_10690 [Candidatus Eisenbacteria bacterium]|nr:hypothetical protein [Candidatus Eisenbacteria bacterium]
MMLRNSRGLIGLAMALLVIGGGLVPVQGFTPAEQNSAYEIPLKEFDLHNYSVERFDEISRDVTTSIANRYGGNWTIYSWNPQTRTPSYIYGSGVDLAVSLSDDFNAESAARTALAANAGVLGLNPANLQLHEVTRGLGKTAVHFQQMYEGLEVEGGRAHTTFMDTGRLFVMSSNYYSDIQVDPHPTLIASVAEEVARQDLPYNYATDSIEDGTHLLILPVPASETDVSFHLVWRIRVRTEDPIGIWVTHVDAHSGGILWRYNDVQFLNFSGDDEAEVQDATYCNGINDQAQGYQYVTVSGVGTVTTDINGNWSLSYGGTDSKAITSEMNGPWCHVENVGGGEALYSGTATPGVPYTVHWDGTWAQNDERDVFNAVNDIHDYFLEFAPTFSYVNTRMNSFVSRNSTCNAYWDGTINFYIEGGGCANTGEIQGVVHHEFGHGIQYTILGSQGNEGLGEGNGDIIATLMTGESIIGRGFYLNQCGSGIRDCNNNLIYPNDVVGQPIHSAGRVICGFNWDMWQELQNTYDYESSRILAGELWHYGRVLEHPMYQPDQVLAYFIADDDDGNLDNGTPHYNAICTGATNHNFDCPEILEGVLISHIPPVTPVPEGDVILAAEIFSTITAMDPDSVRVIYRKNGGSFISAPMTNTGGNDYELILAGQTEPADVEYYIHAVDQEGNYRNAPSTAPAEFYSFAIPTLFDDIESEEGWSVNDEGSDNATTGAWERGDPEATSAQPENDHTPAPGVNCWITGRASGTADGTFDIDGGTTSLYSPVYDMSGASFARVKYHRWYSNDKGNAPNADIWVVQARNNGGAWQDIENTQSNQNQWYLTGGDLLALFGSGIGDVQFKFIASDLSDPSLVEAGVDDFMLLLSQGATDVEGTTTRLAYRLEGAAPNPFTPQTVLRFEVPEAVRASLRIYGVDGRLVRNLMEDTVQPGRYSQTWDARDDAGREVAAGVYYYILDAGGFRATRQMVLVK